MNGPELTRHLIIRGTVAQDLTAALSAVLTAAEDLVGPVNVTITPQWAYPEDAPEGVGSYSVEVTGTPAGHPAGARPEYLPPAR